jgi:hypothetical protein
MLRASSTSHQVMNSAIVTPASAKLAITSASGGASPKIR